MTPAFSAALLIGPERAPLAGALRLAQGLVVPGGALRLLTQVERPPWEPEPPTALSAWLDPIEARQRAALEEVRAAGFTGGAGLGVGPSRRLLAEEAQAVGAELVVLYGAAEGWDARAWVDLALEAGLALAWPGPARGPSGVVLALWPPGLEEAPGLAMLLARLGPRRVVVLGAQGAAPEHSALEDLQEALGRPVDWREAPLRGLGAALAEVVLQEQAELLLTPAPTQGGAASGLLARLLAPALLEAPCPVLLAPGAARFAGLRPYWEASDLLSHAGVLHGRLEQVDPLGGLEPVDQERVVALEAGRELVTVPVHQGRLELPLPAPSPVGLVAIAPLGDGLPLLHAQAAARVLGGEGPGRVVLFDAQHPPTEAARGTLGPGWAWWGLRLDETQRLGELRAGLRAAGLRALLDARTLLQDSPEDALPPEHRGIRLLRLGRVLRAQGVPVAAVLAEGRAEGFAALNPGALTRDPAAAAAAVAQAWRPPLAGADALGERCWARPCRARALRLHPDNHTAREALLGLIGQAQVRVHVQVYMFHDDRVGGQVAEALAQAAARGVEVRVLVDSLWSLHGSFGQENPLLLALDQRPGVQLRTVRPLSGLPSVDGLRGRDHRKLVLVDGRVALVGGRNLGDTYYTGFGEVALHPQSPQHEVPWLDLSAAVEGEVVGALEVHFAAAWAAAGGEAPPPLDPGPPGELALRVINHEGMRDTCTLDAYRALIDGAQRALTVVNTFPIQQELLDALARAVGRGVRVRVLQGHVSPLRGDGEPFPGGAVRQLFTQLIHGRTDALVELGAEVCTLGVPPQPGWDPEVGVLRPHVHTKLVSVDGERFTIGSANLDLSAGFWESEALLLVEDAGQTAAVDGWLEGLLQHAQRVDPEDEAWRRGQPMRAWLNRSWPRWMT